MTATEIKESRKKLGLTQEGLARLLGVSLGTVQTWEGGKRNIKDSTAVILKGHVNKQITNKSINNAADQLIEDNQSDNQNSLYTNIRIQINSLETDYPDTRWAQLKEKIDQLITENLEAESSLRQIQGILFSPRS